MKYSISFRDMKGNGDLINHIDRRFAFAFGRIRHEVETIEIIISDLNGPRAGVDKQCKIVLKPHGMRRLVVTETQDNVIQAIDRGLDRASQSFSRKLKRRRTQRRSLIPPVVATGIPSDLMKA